MNKKDFITMRNESTKSRFDMGDAKAEVYTRCSDDRLENFRSNAERLKLTQEIVWSVYFNKHIDAIMSYTSKGIEGPEGIESNISDAQNYLDLLRAMVRDKKIIIKYDESVNISVYSEIGETKKCAGEFTRFL